MRSPALAHRVQTTLNMRYAARNVSQIASVTCISHFLTHQLQTRNQTKKHPPRSQTSCSIQWSCHPLCTLLWVGPGRHMNRAVTVYPLPNGSQITVRVQSVDLCWLTSSANEKHESWTRQGSMPDPEPSECLPKTCICESIRNEKNKCKHTHLYCWLQRLHVEKCTLPNLHFTNDMIEVLWNAEPEFCIKQLFRRSENIRLIVVHRCAGVRPQVPGWVLTSIFLARHLVYQYLHKNLRYYF